MAEHDEPVTSAALARAMRTNPVVVRRTMAGLRRSGYVRSERGHGGGWKLACDLESTTLLDIYRALGSPTLVGLGFDDVPATCLVQRAVDTALADARRQAESVLLDRFSEITLAQLGADFHRGMTSADEGQLENAHAL
ncbi:MAG: Rrf2 family transcriptional regulator [Thermomicrobiales bacterium]|nr:Rrf2 family transcriptional regulator [Thermomicrobiales bacterium]